MLNGYDDTTVSHRPPVPSHKHIAPAVIFEWNEINSCLRGSGWVEKLESLNWMTFPLTYQTTYLISRISQVLQQRENTAVSRWPVSLCMYGGSARISRPYS